METNWTPPPGKYYVGQVIEADEIGPIYKVVSDYLKSHKEYPEWYEKLWYQDECGIAFSEEVCPCQFPITLLRVPDELRCDPPAPPKERRRLTQLHELAEVEGFSFKNELIHQTWHRGDDGSWPDKAIHDFNRAIANGWPVYAVEGE